MDKSLIELERPELRLLLQMSSSKKSIMRLPTVLKK